MFLEVEETEPKINRRGRSLSAWFIVVHSKAAFKNKLGFSMTFYLERLINSFCLGLNNLPTYTWLSNLKKDAMSLYSLSVSYPLQYQGGKKNTGRTHSHFT